MPKIATLLSIAGSDPSGGAGIQADLKTMTAIGVYGAAAITCLTVQNSCGVQNIELVNPEFVRQQVQAVLEDHLVSHIKIGMLGSAAVVEVVNKLLSDFKGTVVYDPVLSSTTGQSLLSKDGLNLLQELLVNCSFLTPNKQELALLSGIPQKQPADGIHGAEILLDKYPAMKGVVVKGGHFSEDQSVISDFLVLQDSTRYESKRERISNKNLHGTGCTFATAFSAYLLLKKDEESAFRNAGTFMEKVIRAGIDKQICSSGSNGPLLHYLAT